MTRFQMAVLSAVALGVTFASTDGPWWWVIAAVVIGWSGGWMIGRHAHR